jgi:hypothetical protein
MMSFELRLFDQLKVSWFVISMTTTPSKVMIHQFVISFVYIFFPINKSTNS